MRKKERITMTDREAALHILKMIPEYKMPYVVAYLQGLVAFNPAQDEFMGYLHLTQSEDAKQTAE